MKEQNNKDFEKGKKNAKDIIDNATKCYLVATNNSCAIVGDKVMCMSVVCGLLNQMLKNNLITNDDLNKIFELAKKSDEELKLGAKKVKSKIDKIIDEIMED